MTPSERPAITLDAGGVLLLPDPGSLREAVEAHGATPDDETCWWAHYEAMRVLDGMAEIDYPELSRRMAAALGVPLDRCAAAAPAVSEAYLSDRWVPAPGAADALQQLVDRGWAVAVVSNSTHGRIGQLLDDAGICGASGGGAQVVVVLDSAVVGVEKPDPGIFEAALDALGAAPSACTHVGDSLPLDVRPALDLGMRAVHVDPHGACAATGHEHAASLAAFVRRDGHDGQDRLDGHDR